MVRRVPEKGQSVTGWSGTLDCVMWQPGTCYDTRYNRRQVCMTAFAADAKDSHVATGIEASHFISRGQLVPNELVTRLVFDELNRHKSDNWLIDGFPRNEQQAVSLDEFCDLTAVIDLLVPHEEIIGRISGRLIHEASGRVYNTQFKPPLTPGKDDVTGEPLVKRSDDRPDVVKARLVSYDKETAPILHHYRRRGLLHQFRGTQSLQIYTHVSEFLKTLTV